MHAKIVMLDSRARQFVRAELRRSSLRFPVLRHLMKNCTIRDIHCYAHVSTREDDLYNFHKGGKTTEIDLNIAVTKDLIARGISMSSPMIIIPDPAFPETAEFLKTETRFRFWLSEGSIYWWSSVAHNEAAEVTALLRFVRYEDGVVAMLVDAVQVLPHSTGSDIRQEELSALTDTATTVIVTAYDAETYLICDLHRKKVSSVEGSKGATFDGVLPKSKFGE